MASLREFFWSRMPGAAELFGRWRFERLVAQPVPPHLGQFEARFDVNITYFRFVPPFARDGELSGFKPAVHSGWPLHRTLLADHVGQPTGHLHRVIPSASDRVPPTTVWLYVNDTDGKGAVVGIP